MINYMIFTALAMLILVNAAFTQNTKSTKNVIDLLAGEVQENGLPAGWTTAVDNFDCTIKYEGSIYFERLSLDEKCSFSFKKDVPNGTYLLRVDFSIDGNEPEILLNGKPLKQKQTIKVTDGKISIGIRTKGKGKVWGWIRVMTITKTK